MTVKIPPRAAQNAAVMPHGYTPFMRAARSADVETMKLLVAHGADPNKAADDHNTPLIAAGAGMGARFQGGEEKPEADFVECMKVLVASGADVNAADDHGDTALHGAAARGADQIIQFLADHGARFDIKNKQDRTPLEVAMGVGGVANTGGGIASEHGGTAAEADEHSGEELTGVFKRPVSSHTSSDLWVRLRRHRRCPVCRRRRLPKCLCRPAGLDPG